MLLQVNDLAKRFIQPDKTEIEVLQAINFSLDKGETLSIMGVSGSGKSTLLALLAGLDQPTQGSIILNGCDLTTLSEKALNHARTQIGIVFQNFYLIDHLSVLENVMLPLEIAKSDEIVAQAMQLLDSVGLSARCKHFPSQLSGGEAQRLGIARALANKPAILLADEPTGNLDKKNADKIAELLFDLVEKYTMALILVTHNQALAQHCAQQVNLIDGTLHFNAP